MHVNIFKIEKTISAILYIIPQEYKDYVIDCNEMINLLAIEDIDVLPSNYKNNFLKELGHIQSQLDILLSSLNRGSDLKDVDIPSIFEQLKHILTNAVNYMGEAEVKNMQSNDIYDASKTINSLKEKIEQTEKAKFEIETELDKLKKDPIKSKLEEKEKELSKANTTIKETNRLLDELELKEKARFDWSEKIRNCFDLLSTHLKPLKSERLRLKTLFYTFVCLGVSP